MKEYQLCVQYSRISAYLDTWEGSVLKPGRRISSVNIPWIEELWGKTFVSVFKGYEPNTIAVLAEDIAAVAGVVIAGTGIGLSAYTGVWRVYTNYSVTTKWCTSSGSRLMKGNILPRLISNSVPKNTRMNLIATVDPKEISRPTGYPHY